MRVFQWFYSTFRGVWQKIPGASAEIAGLKKTLFQALIIHASQLHDLTATALDPDMRNPVTIALKRQLGFAILFPVKCASLRHFQGGLLQALEGFGGFGLWDDRDVELAAFGGGYRGGQRHE